MSAGPLNWREWPCTLGRRRIGRRKRSAGLCPKELHEVIFPQAESFVPEPSDGLDAVGKGYDLGPGAVPFDGRVGVWLRCPPDLCEEPQIGLYR